MNTNTDRRIPPPNELGGTLRRDFMAKYLIIDVAGKWWSTSDYSSADYVTLTELKVYSGNTELTITPTTDIRGNVTLIDGSFGWNNSCWNKSNLVDNNINYSTTVQGSSTVFFVSDNALSTDYFARAALSISDSNATIDKISVWAGSPEWRIPKEVSFYLCDSYNVTTNLTQRSNEGLIFFGKIQIPSTQTSVARFDLFCWSTIVNKITPTHLYERQHDSCILNVTVLNGEQAVPYALLLNNNIIFQESSETERTIPMALFNVGDNQIFALVNGYQFPIATIKREAWRRTSVERTFKNYDGGYETSAGIIASGNKFAVGQPVKLNNIQTYDIGGGKKVFETSAITISSISSVKEITVS